MASGFIKCRLFIASKLNLIYVLFMGRIEVFSCQGMTASRLAPVRVAKRVIDVLSFRVNFLAPFPSTDITTMLSPVVLLVVLLVLPAVYLLTPPKAGTIPLASGRLPLIGHGLAYGTNPITFLTRQRAQHGNIFLVDLSIIKPIFLLGPEANNLFFGATEKKGLSFYAIFEFMFGKRAHDCTPQKGVVGNGQLR
jgi:hypothetical protein